MRHRYTKLEGAAIGIGSALILLLGAGSVLAQWPQWGGPNRDFKVESKGLFTEWGEAGPKLLWKRALGDGESSVLVDGGMLYTTYRDGEEEVVVALKPDSGEEYRGHSPDCGYGSSPLAYDGTVIVPVGGEGHGVMVRRTTAG